MATDAERARVARVRAYPFHSPARDVAEAFELGGGCRLEGPALVAFGANAAPVVLASKLGADARVSAVPATLLGVDVVFSAHFSPYGAIPATLAPSPGTSVSVHLLAVDAVGLRALDATEGNYRRVGLADGLEAYVSRHGPLLLDGAPRALAAVAARGRRLEALSEEQALERVRLLLEPGAEPDTFVADGARDADVRSRRTLALNLYSAVASTSWT